MSSPKKKKQDRFPVSLRDRQALLEHNPAPQETIDEALKIKEFALFDFGLGDSVTASVLFSKCHFHVPTTAIDTMAVTLMGDGTAMLMYNPFFTVRLGNDGAKFVLFHESRHLIYRHLFSEPHLRNDKVFTHAIELGINHDTMVRLRRTGMPLVATLGPDGLPVLDKSGHPMMEPTGIDPKAEHVKYSADLKKQGLTPVSFADFVRTDYGCYAELKRMKTPPVPPEDGYAVCMHGDDGDGSGDGADGKGGSLPQDDETASEIAEQVLRVMMQSAAGGNEKARQEIIELADRTEGASEKTAKMWGDLGIGRLRGQTLATRKVDWWKQWLNDQLASKLQEGDKLQYNKKRGALDLMLGNDPILMRRGDEEVRVALVAIDTSGSMPDHVLRYLTQLVGHTDGVEFHWVAFDGQVEPFQAGQAVTGGGGTNFGVVMDYAEGRTTSGGHRLDEHPDVILMVTDGYASPIRPAEPDKWVWLITEGGDDAWIRAQENPMASNRIKTGDGVN